MPRRSLVRCVELGVPQVPSTDFHGFLHKDDKSKAERLFRAAVSAFCSLTRPSRRDAIQLDDLTLPLLPMVGAETRRYVAAALSECEIAPGELIRRLCDDPADICAPLLMRSPILREVDLIALISRHGAAHARAISVRSGLNDAILKLIRTLDATVETRAAPENDAAAPARVPGARAEAVRDRLRGMMLRHADDSYPGATIRPFDAPACYAKLRDTALTGNPTLFQTALADALKLNFRTACSITETPSYQPLLSALKALELNEEQAYLVASAVYPDLFAHAEATRLFLERFRALAPEEAELRVRGWKIEMVANWINEKLRPGNGNGGQRAQAS